MIKQYTIYEARAVSDNVSGLNAVWFFALALCGWKNQIEFKPMLAADAVKLL